MSAEGARPGPDQNSTLSQRIDSMIVECRRRDAPPRVDEVERLYTDGCAEVLTLEAAQLRMKRRLTAPGDGGLSDSEAKALSERAERTAVELAAVRSQLRQLRAALEWVQSEVEIERGTGSDRWGDDVSEIPRRGRFAPRRPQPESCSPPAAS